MIGLKPSSQTRNRGYTSRPKRRNERNLIVGALFGLVAGGGGSAAAERTVAVASYCSDGETGAAGFERQLLLLRASAHKCPCTRGSKMKSPAGDEYRLLDAGEDSGSNEGGRVDRKSVV